MIEIIAVRPLKEKRRFRNIYVRNLDRAKDILQFTKNFDYSAVRRNVYGELIKDLLGRVDIQIRSTDSDFEPVIKEFNLVEERSYRGKKEYVLMEEKEIFYMNKDFTAKDRHLVANDIYTKYCENDVIATEAAYMAIFNDKRKPEIEKVIFSGPCTIVLWSDGDKTMVRCENETFDKEKGLAMAISKKFLGSNKSKSNYYDIFEKWIPEEEAEETVSYYSVQEFAKMIKVSESTVLNDLRNGKIFGARKENGKWVIPFPS